MKGSGLGESQRGQGVTVAIIVVPTVTVVDITLRAEFDGEAGE
jgi:hypothetical protein